MLESEKYKKMQNMKCYAYIIAGVVFQTIIILVFALMVMRIKTPSLRLRSATVHNINYDASGALPHFNMTLVMEVAVKNMNFGHFRFENTTANVTFGSAVVGHGEIIKSRASARKTERMNITADIVSSSALSDENELRTELSSGSLTLNVMARLRGKVTLMKVMKKRKTAEMNCTMTVNLTSHDVQDLDCE